MSYTVTLQQRIQQLKKAQADLPGVLEQTARTATREAISATQAATPPKEERGPYIGLNMISGELKAHWKTDSVVEPRKKGSTYVTVLANDMDYASYVNDGHRLKRHFVYGLYVDEESGLLSYDPSKKTGLVVGTKTPYVKGEFMVDKGKAAYEETVISELDKEIRRLLE